MKRSQGRGGIWERWLISNHRKEFPMLDRVKSFLRSEDGPTATEYAVMLALIIIICLGAIAALGTKVNDIFGGVKSGREGQGL